MNRKKLKQLHNLECKNMQWSWAFVNHQKKYIVVQVFQEQNENKVYSPTWGNRTQASHSEYREYLDLVRNKNYSVKAVQATGYLDPNTNNFHLAGYHGRTLIDARLEIDTNGDVFFYPKKDGMGTIIDKRN
jgi:hypothetical protein